MNRTLGTWLVGIVTCFASLSLWAGGSGYNVVIVVNQNSTNSVQLGNYYRAQRNVPPQNFLRINWPVSSNIEWTLSNYTNTLLNPLLNLISTQKLTNQIDYVVLSMDVPYRVSDGVNGFNSTTSALFYGYTLDPGYTQGVCDLAANSTSKYAASESIFRSTPPISASSNSWLATMLASSNSLALGEMQVLQGVISDGTFPAQPTILNKGSQDGYNIRYSAYDNAIFNTRLRGNYNMYRTNSDAIFSSTPVGGTQMGAYAIGLSSTPPNLFVPGAMADDLNSFGGQFLQNTAGETLATVFLSAGATGSYGTVTEPCDYAEKFPDPQNYLYQARGFSLAECYYQSVTNPYQGLVVGEPLAAPFARPATGAWTGLASNAILSGVTNLHAQFTAADAEHPVQQVDLFLDGNWLQTVTNIAPRQGDVLNVSLNGFATNITVPPSATIKSVASNLTTALSGALYQNNTKVAATQHGDRIQLQSTAAFTKTGAQIPVIVGSSNSSGAATTFIRVADGSPATFLDSIAEGIKGYELSGTVAVNSHLTLTVTKTNNTVVTVSVTNTSSSATLTDFAQQLLNAIGSNASLQAGDGLTAGDLETDGSGNAYFNIQAQGQGFAAAQITAALTASGGITVNPSGTITLTDNANDLAPRNHLYITAGVTNLPVTIPFTTTNQTDGYHEIAAVAYEGSHVRTQARAVQNIIIKNTSLSATFTAVLSGTNSALQPTLTFTVTANEGGIATIQLFSTGGLLASASGQSSAVFSVPYANLGIGVHPFYAIVTDNSGHQYRTPTQSIGLIGVSFSNSTLFGVDFPFTLQISGPTPMLVWPATAGRTYNILSTTNLFAPFQLETTVTPTSALGQFTETNAPAAQQFYRISVTP